MTDPRLIPVTITMSAEEWDSFGYGEDRSTSYASTDDETRNRAIEKLLAANPGHAERFAVAKAEADARRPVLDRKSLTSLRHRLRNLISWWETGSREGVSHLGAGAPFTDALEITNGALRVSPVRDAPTLTLYLLPEFSFGGKYPYFTFTADERAALVKAVGSVRKVEDSWTGANWVSISFRPSRIPQLLTKVGL